MKPAMVVIGVLSSWDTLATKLRRIPSTDERETAMLLSAAASSATSSLPSTGTRTLKSPSPKARVAAAI